MDKKLYSLLLSVLIAVFSLQGVEVRAQKNFGQEADKAYDTEQYSVAIDLYKQAYNKVKKNKAEKARILFRLAECYRKTNQVKQSINWYNRVIKANYPDPLAWLYLAEALKADEQYAEAILKFTEYQKLAPEDPRGKQGTESCELAQKWKDDPTRYVVENVKKFNTKLSDFATYWGDKNYKVLLFTSTREGSTGNATDGWTGQSFSDIYVTYQDKKGAWSEPLPCDENINSTFNEGTPWLNKKANVIYFTRCPVVKKSKMGCQIYYAKKQGKGWAAPDTLKMFDDMSIAVGHPSLDDEECTIYFASDAPGGYGGRDIWMAKRSKRTKPFDKPVNLGPTINGAGDEMFPYLRDDGSLYYSSNSYNHPGMGGLDLFKTVKEGDKWGKSENMKYPINSAGDDFAIIFKGNKEEGYFSSNRKGGKGDDDIYSFYIPPLVFTLQGVVRDDSTKQIIVGALVKLEGSDGTIVEDSTDATGTYKFGKTQILENTSYELTVSKSGYFSTKGRETTVGLKNSKDLVHDFVLIPIPPVPIVLPDIYYDLAKWDLKPQYQDSLNGLIQTLNDNPRIVIELASHTDSRPIPMTNDTLSQRRAQSVVNYLIEKGINPGRLVAKGYGAHVPRTLDRDRNVIYPPPPKEGGKPYFFAKGTQITDEYIKTLKTKELKEAAHQLNRRTEFTILRDDFVPEATQDTNAQNVVVVINPNDNIVNIMPGGAGTFEARCIVNGMSMDFKYDAAEGLQISVDLAKQMLNERRITKSDFKEKDGAFNEDGSFKENTVLIIKKMVIGTKKVENVEATLTAGLNPPILIGSKVLTKFGEYSVDEEKRQLIFDIPGVTPNK